MALWCVALATDFHKHNYPSLQIRTIKSTVEETCTKADAEVEKLVKLKYVAEKSVRELELRAVATCSGANDLIELGPKSIKKTCSGLHVLQEKEALLRSATQSIKEKVIICPTFAIFGDPDIG